MEELVDEDQLGLVEHAVKEAVHDVHAVAHLVLVEDGEVDLMSELDLESDIFRRSTRPTTKTSVGESVRSMKRPVSAK